MQPRTVAIIVTLLPLLAVGGSYLISASAGSVPWCMPLLDGCTSISRAGRYGDAIYLFRATMIPQAIFLIWFWFFAKGWLDLLKGGPSRVARVMCWFGVVGALFLILYVDFLGSSGQMYRFMRRYGVIFYFTFTPLAQMILLNQLYKLQAVMPELPIDRRVLRYQLTLVVAILLIGIISLVMDYGGLKSDASGNIVEWNIALLTTIYFAGTAWMWKDFRYSFKKDPPPNP